MVCGVWVNYGLWVKWCVCVCVWHLAGWRWVAQWGFTVTMTTSWNSPDNLNCIRPRRGFEKSYQWKIEGVTHSLTGKQYFLKYYDHLGTFSLKILYSRCIFVKQSRVIFSYTRFEEQWLNVTILWEPGNWLYRGVWFSWHSGGRWGDGLCGHVSKKQQQPFLGTAGLNWGGQAEQHGDAHVL